MTAAAEVSADVHQRLYALMVLMKAADIVTKENAKEYYFPDSPF